MKRSAAMYDIKAAASSPSFNRTPLARRPEPPDQTPPAGLPPKGGQYGMYFTDFSSDEEVRIYYNYLFFFLVF
jgi:hypothetical protein